MFKLLLITTLFASLFLTRCIDNDEILLKGIVPESDERVEVPSTPIEEPEEIPEPTVDTNEHASNSTSFLTLPNGKTLSSIKVKGASLRLAKGTGKKFTDSKAREYLKLKKATLNDQNHKVQWAFMNLDTGEIERSLGADRKIFGASSSKVFVAATLLVKQEGKLRSSQLQKMSDMLVVSSNTAWTSMQKHDIGDGSSNKGRELNHNFTQTMGYKKTRGYQGYWGEVHGNELTPDESVEFLYDTYRKNFPGAETLWKLMYTCRTGSNRGRKYLPSSLYVGGKTGSYSGPTENPQTGKSYRVKMKNHILVFAVDGVQYGLAVLANSGTDESAALIAGGLIREYTSVK